MLLAAGIGSLAHVIAVRAGGVHLHQMLQTRIRHHFFQHAMGSGTAADISGADHENANGFGGSHG
jgi:hypothetical protein